MRTARVAVLALAVTLGGCGETTFPFGLERAYTWDGSQVHAFSLGGSLDRSGIYYATESFRAVTPAASPGTSGPKLVLSADEKTAFLAGDSAVVVVPLP